MQIKQAQSKAKITSCSMFIVYEHIPNYVDIDLFLEEEKVYPGSGIVISILSILLVISVGFNVVMKCRMSSRYIGNTEQAITQVQTGLENYENLSDARERHLYTTMTATA